MAGPAEELSICFQPCSRSSDSRDPACQVQQLLRHDPCPMHLFSSKNSNTLSDQASRVLRSVRPILYRIGLYCQRCKHSSPKIELLPIVQIKLHRSKNNKMRRCLHSIFEQQMSQVKPVLGSVFGLRRHCWSTKSLWTGLSSRSRSGTLGAKHCRRSSRLLPANMRMACSRRDTPSRSPIPFRRCRKVCS